MQPNRLEGNFNLFLDPFTIKEVNKLINKTDVTKSFGLNNINATALRDDLTALQSKFLKILNLSVNQIFLRMEVWYNYPTSQES